MATEKIVMPQLGESVTEGTISKWLVQPGDQVKKYDPLAEVMTDKVNAEVPSSFTGTIKELVAQEGETLAVGELICYIDTEGGNAQAEPKEETAAAPVQQEVTHPEKGADAEEKSRPKREKSGSRFSPAVLRLADEHNIDLNQVEGTGMGGRITRKDLLKLIESGSIPVPGSAPAAEAPIQEAANVKAPEAQTPAPQQQAPKSAPSIESLPGDIEIPVTGVRKAIAANMVRSKHEAPHAWTMVEVDVTNLVEYRNSVKNEFKSKEGYNLTFLPFFIKAVVESLKEYPQLNSMWAGDKIIQKKDINISIAVATETALYVPVIKNADEKSIKGVAREVKEMADKVRSNRLGADDMKGGTFTVNNTGSFGSVMSTPIINYPQAAILSVESIVKRPVVMNNGMIAVRDMVNLCLSLDHRVLDGLVCGRFLASLKKRLESITPDNTSIY
ncbi:2-oxoisovalerate dehydrogenase E2 component (dihydrolipoyl transacylase) [Fictibacillus enclensis]|uniref:Dihydrolipoamide acetyltransferase component of pyruvate dehydrogenase complex n=1 Tax=Fictibacillus enclensis TaxID=1017270 RepID=A0A0V8JFK7_9BACL|nr:dihydrolipoamide acetyltransferase family protein [Fictibacillus enclensis]KSU85688.1 branched-chain alpha-keto acid dehydrogenase subunit E2 [Fictibacillus enclensis]SCC00994.1 2-oxoisovalerate dehydrogenase E2 component (dihydrolipoyl transacylase) [Fictibacillus enclensis]